MDENYTVRSITDIPYGDHPQQALDLYLPRKPAPVIFFVHGGGWSRGHREMYANLGHFYAKKGYAVVVVDHRLSPEFVHPAHIEDITRAFIWVENNIQSPSFLFGHSSGAHLCSLLATRLKNTIKGVIVISGVYNLGSNLEFAGLGHVFSPEDRYNASPVNFIEPDLPPFLILYAEKDVLTLAGQARVFDTKLKRKSCSDLHVVKNQDHVSVITDCAISGTTSGLILDFMRKNE